MKLLSKITNNLSIKLKTAYSKIKATKRSRKQLKVRKHKSNKQ